MSHLSTALSNLSKLTTTPDYYSIENGELVPRGSCCLCCFWAPQETEDELQRKVRFLTENVKILNASNREELIDHASEIQALFFRTLPHCQYNRSEVTLQG